MLFLYIHRHQDLMDLNEETLGILNSSCETALKSYLLFDRRKGEESYYIIEILVCS